ncbi:MAG: thioredoxin-disulfide reductase [Candidatus Gastranaerophilales bacterium]|nr:thioredoxin-disulfide reductase [Candidatus Gastranaerophilales bacterium]
MNNFDKNIFDCLILGGGPAGMSGALYCSRANLNCAIIDSSALGGAPANYCEIENYLGFNRIEGAELCERFEEHINNFNVQKFPFEEIQSVELTSDIKKITTEDKELFAKSIIIATGAKPQKLNVKGEKEFFGRGVSYCAVCDGAFYKNKITAVVGGGNSALEEALYLTRFCDKVYLIHRRGEFRADKIIQKRIFENKKIELVLNSVVEEIIGDNKVQGIKIKNVSNNEIKTLVVQGVFPYIGLSPNSELFTNQLQTDEKGFIITDNTMQTNIQGVYAIGDIRNTPLRQVITAVSDGAIAGVSVSKYLMNIEKGAVHESISL